MNSKHYRRRFDVTRAAKYFNICHCILLTTTTTKKKQRKSRRRRKNAAKNVPPNATSVECHSHILWCDFDDFTTVFVVTKWSTLKCYCCCLCSLLLATSFFSLCLFYILADSWQKKKIMPEVSWDLLHQFKCNIITAANMLWAFFLNSFCLMINYYECRWISD